ncbi:MAG: nucleoside-diphosphate kinase [Deltaproteobacteria bacterium]|nr:nucleoside-diphosphate kinase [Deltaproteobacteria bacterium]
MAIERTLSIIKPDGVERNLIGKVLTKFEDAGLKVVGARLIHLSVREAELFYSVHSERGFFGELVEFMSRSAVFVTVLEGENAVAANRDIMGATNPANAAEGTIRKEFALSIGENTVHGSDSLENAANEIAFFFSGTELHGAR